MNWFYTLLLCFMIVGFGQFQKAQSGYAETAKILFEISMSLEDLKADCGRFPTTEEGLQSLLTPPAKNACPNWAGPYLAALNSDYWDRSLIYESKKGKDFIFGSLGSDRKNGGSGSAADCWFSSHGRVRGLN